MSQFQQLLAQTSSARQQFIELPLIQETMRQGGPKGLYLDFLGQAYHHVKHTPPLLALATSRCGPPDHHYQSALLEYIGEEQGHDEWILEDIDALGGDSDAVRRGSPRLPCKVMVSHAYYLIDHVSAYGLLGMIHVLEGMSVALAGQAARAIRTSLQAGSDAGFKYLTTHGDLDQEHTKLFERLLDGLDPRHLPVVIEATCDFYRLYGGVFQDIDARRETAPAAVVKSL
jgi:pyrroloquinoline quinone (PQQ) biosynthesis protein C